MVLVVSSTRAARTVATRRSTGLVTRLPPLVAVASAAELSGQTDCALAAVARFTTHTARPVVQPVLVAHRAALRVLVLLQAVRTQAMRRMVSPTQSPVTCAGMPVVAVEVLGAHQCLVGQALTVPPALQLALLLQQLQSQTLVPAVAQAATAVATVRLVPRVRQLFAM